MPIFAMFLAHFHRLSVWYRGNMRAWLPAAALPQRLAVLVGSRQVVIDSSGVCAYRPSSSQSIP